ncbi:hypothetical protein ACHAW5_009017 [Stephanodiscus triporus]|uniref:Uncharacterized protein n=1 Tax=Stephanodiscus triporus TaxID=2934178 RepID=A0ABD3NM51_9STRA
MTSATKKKSTTESDLPDGSRVKEYVVEETNPDGSRTVTTTQVKTSKVKRTLHDGSQVTEDVSTTTTTTKRIPARGRQQQREGNVIQNAVNAVGGFALDLFGGGSSVNNKGCGAGSVLGEDECAHDPPPPEFDDVSTMAGDPSWEAATEGQRQWQQQQQQQLQSQQRQRQWQAQTQGRPNGAATKRAGTIDHRDVSIEQWGDSESLPPTSRAVAHRDHPSAFYPTSRHPNGGGPYFANEDSRRIGRAGNHNMGGSNGNGSAYAYDNYDDDADDGNESVPSANFMLYENDRLETQLPTFHRALPASVGSSKKSGGSGGGVGRTIINKLTPSLSGSNRDVRYNRSGGSHRSGGDSGQRLSPRSTPGGICQYQPPQQQQQQRGRSSTRQDKHTLDPEVVNAIELIRQRSKSPLRGRREYLPPRSPGSQQSPFLEDQQVAHQEAIAMQEQYQLEASRWRQEQYQQERPGRGSSLERPGRGASLERYGPPRHLANHNEWDDDVSDERDDCATYDGMAPRPYGPPRHLANHNEWDDDVSDERDDCATYDGMAPRPSAPRLQKNRMAMEPAPTKKGKMMQRQQSTIEKIQGKVPIIPPPTLVNHSQVLLTKDSFTTSSSAPKIVMHKTNAILTSDRYVHFYSLVQNKWVQTTSVSLQNTDDLSFALCNNTAVVGVPYDRNSRGLLTGAAYIFERDAKTQTWYQVKKIVPKKVGEFANVGYSVDISDNVVCVGVPELGAAGSITDGGCGSVYVYQRAEQYKWMPMGHLTMARNNLDPNCLAPSGGLLAPTATNFGTLVALKHKILVVSNYQPSNLGIGGETSLFVYEYDVSLKNKWRLIQTDLLSTEAHRRNFGSHVALTSNGEGIFIGCHSDVNPTEILYYKRKAQVDAYGNRTYQLQQIITLQEKCKISDFCVDSNDNFVVGTLNSNRVYVYQQMHDLATLEDQGWRLVAKVIDNNLGRQRFVNRSFRLKEALKLSLDGGIFGEENEVVDVEAERQGGCGR